MGTPANFRQKATPKPTPRVHEAQGAKVLAPAVALAFRQSQVVKKLRKSEEVTEPPVPPASKIPESEVSENTENSMKQDATWWNHMILVLS